MKFLNNRFKFVTLIFMVFLAMFSLTGCSETGPEDTVDSFFKKVKYLNEDALNYISSESLDIKGIATTQTTQNYELWLSYFDMYQQDLDMDVLTPLYLQASNVMVSTSWELETTAEDEAAATVAVDLSTIDVLGILEQFIEATGYTSIDQALTDDAADKNAALSQLTAILKSEDADTHYEFELSLVWEDDDWKILIDETFFSQFLDGRIIP